MSYRTNTLTRSEAENFFVYLQESDLLEYKELVEAGGGLTEVRFEDCSVRDLEHMAVPDYCAYVTIDGKKTVSLSGISDVLPLCGSGWELSDEVGETISVRVDCLSISLNTIISFVFEEVSAGMYRGKDWSNANEITVNVGNDALYAYIDSEKPDVENWDFNIPALKKKVRAYLKRYEIPYEGDRGVMECRHNGGHFRVTLSPNHEWDLARFGEFMQRVCGEDVVDSDFQLFSLGSLGGARTIGFGPQNISQRIKHFLSSVVQHDSYDLYSGHFGMIETEDWDSRDEKRKQLSEPVRQETGCLKLDDDLEADVVLMIEKEGYVIRLNFDDAKKSNMLFMDTALHGEFDWIYDGD